MFPLYDYNCQGWIPQNLAKKLVDVLGFESTLISLPAEVTLQQFLLSVDLIAPAPDPPLPNSLYTFNRLVAKNDPSSKPIPGSKQREEEKKIRAEDIGMFRALIYLLFSVTRKNQPRVTNDAYIQFPSFHLKEDFMVSIGRAPPPRGEATMLLTTMLDYDDCSPNPAVPPDSFSRDVMLFSRRHNVFQDFR